MEPLFDDRHEYIDGYGDPYLGLDCVLGGSEE